MLIETDDIREVRMLTTDDGTVLRLVFKGGTWVELGTTSAVNVGIVLEDKPVVQRKSFDFKETVRRIMSKTKTREDVVISA